MATTPAADGINGAGYCDSPAGSIPGPVVSEERGKVLDAWTDRLQFDGGETQLQVVGRSGLGEKA